MMSATTNGFLIIGVWVGLALWDVMADEGASPAWKDGRVSDWAWNQRPTFDHEVDLPTTRPLNIAHRGSSGTYPEHTLPSYRAGIADGADVIECDVCLTKDLVPVCLHESWLGKMTDAAEKFPDRLTNYTIPGVPSPIQGVFSVDLTLTELKTLKTRQRFQFRDLSRDGQFDIPTLEEFITAAKEADRPVGIYPEIKNPEWVNDLGIVRNADTSFEDIVVRILAKHGYSKKSDPCFLQCFSEPSIQRLSLITELPLVILIDSQEFEIIPDASLERWAKICYGIGVWKRLIVDDTGKNINQITDLIKKTHALGMRVHGYTFRNENRYLAFNYHQDPYNEYALFVSLGMDGFFTDFPKTFSRYLEQTYTTGCSVTNGQSTLQSSSLARLYVTILVGLTMMIAVQFGGISKA